jgi:hypothetical protein
VEDIDFLVDFVAWNSNELQIFSLEGKISWPLNVFTLGPTAQATLVCYDDICCDFACEVNKGLCRPI